jgi:hypothetical protein
MSSYLLDLAIDLINDAKGGKDAKTKLYLLEQIREIVFHRDKTVLKDVLSSVFDFMLEKSAPIRKFLVKFGEEAMAQDPDSTFPHYINLINFLQSDSNDSVLVVLAKSFQRYYEVMVIKIVAMPVVAKASGLADPKQLWALLSAIASRFNDFISSSRSESLKGNCLRVFEAEMTFGLPNPSTSTSSDPRLARKDPRLARAAAATGEAVGVGGGVSKSAEDISLHHPFISRNEVQRAAEEKLTKAVLWSGKGGPQGYPFTPHLMSLLGQVIANVCTSRLRSASTGAKALMALIQGKASMAQAMSGQERGNLARAVHRLLRAATAYASDPEQVMPKLRLAVAALEALGLEVDQDEAGQKRPRDGAAPGTAGAGVGGAAGKGGGVAGAGGGAEDEESAEAAEVRRSSAVAAIDAAESRMRSMNSLAAGPGGEEDDIALLLGSVAAAAPSALTMRGVMVSGDSTELARDLPSLEDPVSLSSIRLVTTVQETSKATVGQMAVGQRPIAQDTSTYADLAMCSFKKLLETLAETQPTERVYNSFSVMCIKSLLSLTLSDIDDNKSTVQVQIVAVVPTNGRLPDDVPAQMTLPRPLWVFLGFALGHAELLGLGGGSKVQLAALGSRVEVLVRASRALYEEVCWQRGRLEEEGAVKAAMAGKALKAEGAEEEADAIMAEDTHRLTALTSAYDSLCVTAMSRLLQTVQLRSAVKEYVLCLPSLPAPCLALLKLLLTTGSKGSLTDSTSHTSSSSRNRGTRTEAMALLGQLVFSADEVAGREALHFLLWCCLEEDFELRTKVIHMVVK